MVVRIISSFRISENSETRKYRPGDLAEGAMADFALSHGFGIQVEDKKQPRNKVGNKKKPTIQHTIIGEGI